MAAQWILARRALELVAGSRSSLDLFQARIPLCSRAHSGLIKTRAKLVIVGTRRFEDHLLPPSFWWPKGRPALGQNWEQGDFEASERPGAGQRVEAYAVEFDLEGVLEMLPVEARPSVRRSISIVGTPGWISSRDALKFVEANAGVGTSAGDALIQAAELGFVSARAAKMVEQPTLDGDDDATFIEWDVPTKIWAEIAAGRAVSINWSLGRFIIAWGRGIDERRMTLSDVHFWEESLQHFRKEAAFTTTETKNAGGRPTAAFWDDLWCHLWGEIYRGAEVPQKLAEIEKRMQEWLSAREYSAAPSTIRLRARKMLAELKRPDENPAER